MCDEGLGLKLSLSQTGPFSTTPSGLALVKRKPGKNTRDLGGSQIFPENLTSTSRAIVRMMAATGISSL